MKTAAKDRAVSATITSCPRKSCKVLLAKGHSSISIPGATFHLMSWEVGCSPLVHLGGMEGLIRMGPSSAGGYCS